MIRVYRTVLTVALAFLLGTSVSLATPEQIGWNDLIPPPVAYENPFDALSKEQISDLRTIMQAQLAPDADAPDVRRLRAEKARQRLEEQGLDIEWLFEQREIVMKRRRELGVATRKELVGKEIRMPGYLLPLDLKDGRAVEFLLVPTVGACIHTPPPPANQMVHVSYPSGIEVSGLYDPVWINGTLLSNFSKQNVRYVDGVARIEVSYAMTADSVEPF